MDLSTATPGINIHIDKFSNLNDHIVCWSLPSDATHRSIPAAGTPDLQCHCNNNDKHAVSVVNWSQFAIINIRLRLSNSHGYINQCVEFLCFCQPALVNSLFIPCTSSNSSFAPFIAKTAARSTSDMVCLTTFNQKMFP